MKTARESVKKKTRGRGSPAAVVFVLAITAAVRSLIDYGDPILQLQSPH